MAEKEKRIIDRQTFRLEKRKKTTSQRSLVLHFNVQNTLDHEQRDASRNETCECFSSRKIIGLIVLFLFFCSKRTFEHIASAIIPSASIIAVPSVSNVFPAQKTHSKAEWTNMGQVILRASLVSEQLVPSQSISVSEEEEDDDEDEDEQEETTTRRTKSSGRIDASTDDDDDRY